LLLGSIGASFAAQTVVLFILGLRNLFGPPLNLADVGLSVAAGAAPLLAIEILRGREHFQSVAFGLALIGLEDDVGPWAIWVSGR
jgi:predicted exporter